MPKSGERSVDATSLAHLSDAARTYMGLADDERIMAMQRDRWVDHPYAASRFNEWSVYWVPLNESECRAWSCLAGPISARR